MKNFPPQFSFFQRKMFSFSFGEAFFQIFVFVLLQLPPIYVDHRLLLSVYEEIWQFLCSPVVTSGRTLVGMMAQGVDHEAEGPGFISRRELGVFLSSTKPIKIWFEDS